MHFVTTNSGKGKTHLVTDICADGMCGDVPRTLCSSMIRKCSSPQRLNEATDPLTLPNLCEPCARGYGDGRVLQAAERIYREDRRAGRRHG